MINIIRVVFPKLSLYKGNTLIGLILNNDELIEVQIQVATEQSEDYYIVHEGKYIFIDKYGTFSEYPPEIFGSTERYKRLIKIQCENRIKDKK